jgi:uncharacterized glyoxalase superfamily protein PhnB
MRPLPHPAMPTTKKKQTKQQARRRATRPPAAPPARPLSIASGLAPGMQSVNSFLAVANVAASITFLERTFGFTRGVVLPDTGGQLRYAEMRHGDSVVILVPKGDGSAPTGGAAALYTYVDDVDAALTLARDAGCGVGIAEDRAWGDRVAAVTDPDGYRWVLATFKKLAPFHAEAERRKGGDRRKS